MARPTSAAEVLDRLAAIASLPRDEQAAVAHAYLSTPELIGRAEELSRVRLRLTELLAGQGGVLAIEGAPGMGRSRMLDTCVLEAKLAGMAVVRASAADALGAYGVVSALVRQLRDAGTGSAQAVAGSEALVLLARGDVEPSVDAARRAELQLALQVLLRARAALAPLALAIDDIDRCDEPSQAALAAAAAACGRDRVLIAVSCTRDAERTDGGALSLLLHGATHVRLAAFKRTDTDALLQSVFGDVPHLPGLAARIHERAEGSPRGCMELAQYLLDRGIVRYGMGSWLLPQVLSDTELPRSLSLARRAKLEALSADARELGEALALADGAGLDFEVYPELTQHGERERVRTALDELLYAQILRNESANYVFEAQVWSDELRKVLSTERSRVLHARIAEALQRRGRDRLDVARYLYRAGQVGRTIDVLLAELAAVASRWDRSPRDYVELLRGCVSACAALRRARHDRIMLLRELVRVGQDLALSDLKARLHDLFGELCRDSGLGDWELPGGPAEPTARLQYVFELMQQRHAAASERERGMPPLEAIIALARISAETCAIAAQTGDVTLLELIPSLEPFHPLSPAIERVTRLSLPACRAVIAARYEEARALYRESLVGLMDPSYAGVDEQLRVWAIYAIHYALGCIEGGLGREQAITHAQELEKVPGWLVAAYSVRQIYHLTLGNLRQAERYRKQIELTLLQSPVKPPLSAGAVHQHLFVFALADNPNGMRLAIPELETLATVHPGLRPFVPFARAEHARICGNHEDALLWIDRMREQVKPGEHPLWPWATSTWLGSLIELERYADARVFALRELETAERVGLEVMRDHIEVPLALAEAKLGDFESACARLDRIIPERLGSGMQGVVVGWAYEARARVALWMDDLTAFEAHAQLCAQQYKKSGGEPALAAKYERLMQEARHRGMTLSRDVTDAMAMHTTVERTQLTTVEETGRVVGPALAACTSRSERVQRALELLVGSAAALAAELFLIEGGALALAASTASDLGGDALLPAFSRMLEVGDGDQATALTAALALQGPARADGTPTQIWPLVIACVREGETAVAGIAALHFGGDTPVRLPTEISTAIATALIEAADVVPHVLGGRTR
jgi:hypothetical protein